MVELDQDVHEMYVSSIVGHLIDGSLETYVVRTAPKNGTHVLAVRTDRAGGCSKGLGMEVARSPSRSKEAELAMGWGSPGHQTRYCSCLGVLHLHKARKVDSTGTKPTLPSVEYTARKLERMLEVIRYGSGACRRACEMTSDWWCWMAVMPQAVSKDEWIWTSRSRAVQVWLQQTKTWQYFRLIQWPPQSAPSAPCQAA